MAGFNDKCNSRYLYKHNILKEKIVPFIIILSIFIAVPYVITMTATGVIPENISGEMINGKSVSVKYNHAVKSTDINKFIIMVLADRYEMSSQTEVLKAEAVMVRTDIYRIMGDNMNIDSDSLGMTFLTERQMRNAWGQDYDTNYNLIADCVAATGNQVLTYNNNLIEAKYTWLSNGSTLSGGQILGDSYGYLSKVECPKDIEVSDFLAVTIIKEKDFIKEMEKVYADIGINKDDVFGDIQVISKTAEGYILKIQVGNVIMTGSDFVKITKLNSSCFALEKDQDGIKFTTKGKGDGFGVSINTADVMASEGSTYDTILAKFYSDVVIVNN